VAEQGAPPPAATPTNDQPPVGCGVTWGMNEDDSLVVSGFAPGSSGPGAGMEIDDVLVAVDGVPVRAMEAADIAPLIKGPAGTEVTLTVERDGQNVECTADAEAASVEGLFEKVGGGGDVPGDVISCQRAGADGCGGQGLQIGAWLPR
ncbi:hypothetical protein T484DRAFT_1774342, partial [Baffinella frigidus]